jgi:hypothetical protein
VVEVILTAQVRLALIAAVVGVITALNTLTEPGAMLRNR